MAKMQPRADQNPGSEGTLIAGYIQLVYQYFSAYKIATGILMEQPLKA
jgi:hypothetical protein